jgi:ABC-2 type transport system permease protein
MRLYWELVKLSSRRHLTYRAATLAGLTTNFFFGLIRVAVFIALYGEQEVVSDISLQGAITYTALTQAVIGYLSMFSWYDLMQTVYSGEVASDLIKPMNYFTYWLAKDMGRAIVTLLLRGLIFMFMFELVFDLIHPSNLNQWLGVFAAIILSWLISFSWRFLISLSSFWTPNAIGILRFSYVLSWFFSGFLMPLRYFPKWVNQITYLTPFPHTVNSVVEVYLGVIQGPEILHVLLLQVIWAIVLIVAGQLILRSGVRRLVILGG